MQKKSLLATFIASVFSIVAFAADGVYTATARPERPGSRFCDGQRQQGHQN